MARPAKMSAEQRGEYVRARLTAAELARFDERAEAAGLSRSEYLRQAALSGRVVIRQTTAIDPRLIAEVNKIGVNLNQLVRTANGTGQVPPDLDRLCQKIEAVVMKAIEQEIDHGPDDRQ